MADVLDVQETSVDSATNLLQVGQLRDILLQAEVGRVVDGGLGTQRTTFLEILLDP